jgi:hypothetical protein
MKSRKAGSWLHLAGVILLAARAHAAPPPELAAVALPHAHAHNDYRHARPLFDALGHGFCSVEADIFLVDGRLLVGHDRRELQPDRTLQSLYLEPLRRLVQQNQGRVYPNGPPLTLLIDIKSDGAMTYEVLHQVLAGYRRLFTRVEGDHVQLGAIDVIISGNRAEAEIAAKPVRYAGIDGRLSDLDSDAPAHRMPLISDNWRSHFRWRGQGPMPSAECEKLRQIVQKAHGRGRRVRFWATPESEAVWQALREASVDLIGTDDLGALRKFLTPENAGPGSRE